MMLYRSALCALLLFGAMPLAGEAMVGAGTMPDARIWIGGFPIKKGLTVLDDGTASSITVAAKSDAGSENVALVESNAWMHGGATIQASFKYGSTIPLKLKLYRADSSSLMSFSGTLGEDGEVSLAADETKETATECYTASKLGCSETTSDASATNLDIEVLAAEVFAVPGGYELALDLAGADTYDVAYAEITLTESTEVTTCDKVNRCTTTGSSTTTTAEVDWDAIGAVWEGSLVVDHQGAIDVKVQTVGASGEAVGNTKVALGVPWDDGGEGVNVLAVDGDPLTTVGLSQCGRFHGTWHVGCSKNAPRMLIASQGWTTTTAPVAAELALDNGETITIPVNSYQRLGRPSWTKKGDLAVLSGIGAKSTIVITGGSVVFADSSLASITDSPVCVSGGCFMLVDDGDGGFELSVTAYASDSTELPEWMDITVTVTDEVGEQVFSDAATVAFDDDVAALFANEVDFSADPVGLELSGRVSLLGAADAKGKQKTLSKGTFYGAFSRDGDGDLGLAGADKNGGDSAAGSIIAAGDALGFELTDTDEDGEVEGPPIVLRFGDIIMTTPWSTAIDFYH